MKFIASLVILALFVCLVAFQNCSAPNFHGFTRGASAKTGNNNGGFDGKAWHSYGDCGQGWAVKARIETSADGKSARLVRDKCADVVPAVSIDPAEFVFPNANNGKEILVWRSALFNEAAASNTNPPPGSVVGLMVFYCESDKVKIEGLVPPVRVSDNLTAIVSLRSVDGEPFTSPATVRIMTSGDAYVSSAGESYLFNLTDLPGPQDDFLFAPLPAPGPAPAYAVTCVGESPSGVRTLGGGR